MKNQLLAFVFVLGVFAVSPTCVSAAQGTKPNIILIMADDMGAECVGCYGCKDYHTPHLDALAKNGIRFTHGYSQPLCTPSRVQIMTAQYNHRNYIGFGNMDPKLVTFGNVLQHAGYATCIVGKWQLGGDLNQPYRFGFDEYCLWQIDGREKRYWKPRIVENKKVRNDVADKYGPDVYCDYLLDFVTRKKAGPFFVYYPMCLPHNPHLPTPNSKGNAPKLKNNNKYFKDMIEYVDVIVGRILQKLDDLKIRDNTLVIFTGDNGTNRAITTQTVNGPIRGGKSLMTNAGTHVPLIANWPGTTPKGKVCQDLIDFSDFMPTLAELAGTKVPQNRIIDGRSFVPQLHGKKGNPREWIFCHYWGYGRKKNEAREFARDQRYKLYHDGAFFDVQADPLEKTLLNKLSPEAETAKVRLGKVFAEVGSKLKKKSKVSELLAPNQADSITLEIKNDEHPRPFAAASFALPKDWQKLSYHRMIELPSREYVATQKDSSGTLHWIVGSPLKPNEKRRYLLTKSNPAITPPSNVRCEVDDKALSVKIGKTPVLRYNTAVLPCPVPKMEACRRSGFIHPVYNPAGQIVTDDFPPDHAHQHGIMFPWTNTTFEGRKVDFWNQHAKKGTVEHVKIVSKQDGNVFAEFTAKLRHIDLTSPDGPEAALDETWKVRVYNVEEYYVFDFESVQECAGKSPLTINKYHYGGMALRAAREWYQPGAGDFLTSDGKSRKDGNHTRPKWVSTYGTIKGMQSGIALLAHPGNFRFPQPVRLHPSKPYFSWSPQVLGPFSITPKKNYSARYRFVVHMGNPDAELLNQIWADYASPLSAAVAK